jgi:hypothetical protein
MFVQQIPTGASLAAIYDYLVLILAVAHGIPACNYILHKFQFVLNFATKATTDEKTKKFQQSSTPESFKWAA